MIPEKKKANQMSPTLVTSHYLEMVLKMQLREFNPEPLSVAQMFATLRLRVSEKREIHRMRALKMSRGFGSLES